MESNQEDLMENTNTPASYFDFPDFAEEMNRRRAEIRSRLGISTASANSGCSSSGCSSCHSTGCTPESNMVLPMSEAYEVC